MPNTKLEGSRTLQNLVNAFAGESQARNRYTYFSKIAKKEGYEQIAAIFFETAENEKEHAKLFYQEIGNIKYNVNAKYPFELGTTEENLESAIAGEYEEWDSLYPESERIAREEGFDKIADIFYQVTQAEKHHHKRYLKLLENIKKGTVFDKDYEADWLCRKCGYVAKSKQAPEKCPNCHHPKAYFEILCENY